MQGGRLIVNMRKEEGGQFNREEVGYLCFIYVLVLTPSSGGGSQEPFGDYVGRAAPAAYWRAGTVSYFSQLLLE